MKDIKDILRNVNVLKWEGPINLMIHSIAFDSRKVSKNSLFVAMKGIHVDSHQFIEEVISKGALAVVCESLPDTRHEGITYIQIEDTNEGLGLLAANFYEHPSTKLKLIGITGTNGKTTTVTLLHRLFQNLGYPVGLLSTIENKVGEQVFPATHTTPDALELQRLLSLMVDSACEYCFMEVSSHAIAQKRIAGLQFYGAIFSNITHDHLDFHKTFASYIQTKKAFFDQLGTDSFALVNKDDKNGMMMVQNTPAKVYTYSLRSMADFHCKVMDSTFQGLQLSMDQTEIWVKLVGVFNAYNLLAIYSVARLCGFDKQEVLTKLSDLDPAEGRFEYIQNESYTSIVDYAHTPDALNNVLETILDIKKDEGQLITVVGCGGDRDKTKRPEMAKVASMYSDKLILTSDNPRTEDPELILDEMEQGIDQGAKRKCIRISNRAEAIKTACLLAKKGDIILVAGKGHEKYQEIKGVKYHFDDKEQLRVSMGLE